MKRAVWVLVWTDFADLQEARSALGSRVRAVFVPDANDPENFLLQYQSAEEDEETSGQRTKVDSTRSWSKGSATTRAPHSGVGAPLTRVTMQGNKEETERGFEASDIYRLMTPARGLPAPSVSCEKALQRLRAMSAVREVEPRLADPFFSATLRPSLSTQQAATKGRVKHLFGR